MDSIHLIGAEDVQRAGHHISVAAEQMGRAAGNIDESLERHRRFLDDWLQRFEQVLVEYKS